MTSLQQLLQEEAASEPVPMAPVNRIVQTGQARVRRRRLAGTAVGVAIVALGAVAVPLLLTADSNRDPVDRDRTTGAPTLESAGVAWAHAGTVHFRGAEAELPPDTTFLTSTSSAAVMVTQDSATSMIFTLDDSGTVRDVGTAVGGVAADPSGDWIAWVDVAAEGDFSVNVYDTGTEELVSTWQVSPVGGAGGPATRSAPYVVAVDGRSVTYANADALMRWTSEDGPQVVRLDDGVRVLDWRGDQLVVTRAGSGGSVVFGTNTSEDVQPAVDVTVAELSPDGAFAVGYDVSPGGTEFGAAAWEVSLLSTVDGAQVPLNGLPGRALMAGWTRTGDLAVLSYDTPFNELSVNTAVRISLCTDQGACTEPSDAPDAALATLGDTVLQVGRLGPLLLSGLSNPSRSSGSATVEEPVLEHRSDQP
jgi:hypothetical protein